MLTNSVPVVFGYVLRKTINLASRDTWVHISSYLRPFLLFDFFFTFGFLIGIEVQVEVKSAGRSTEKFLKGLMRTQVFPVDASRCQMCSLKIALKFIYMDSQVWVCGWLLPANRYGYFGNSAARTILRLPANIRNRK